MMDGAMSSSTVLHTPRLEGQSLCKAERLQALNTPLGPYDRSYSRKRLREHSLERTDCEFLRRGTLTQKSVISKSDRPLMFCSLSQNLPGLEHPLPDTDQHALCTSQPPPSPTLHVFRERHASGCWQPEHLKHTRTEAIFPNVQGYEPMHQVIETVCKSRLMFCINSSLSSDSSLSRGGEVRAPSI